MVICTTFRSVCQSFALLSLHFQVKPTHNLHTTTDDSEPGRQASVFSFTQALTAARYLNIQPHRDHRTPGTELETQAHH
jgi:hypothetical protein